MHTHSKTIRILIVAFLGTMGCNVPKDASLFPFKEDFENGLGSWVINNREKIKLISTDDPNHDKVISLYPGGSNTFILLKGSEDQTNLKVEGDVLFPENTDNYFGFIYNYRITGTRADYGCIYIKGNGSYVRVNPHRDGHVSRVLYDEFKSSLQGEDSIIIGQWQHFKAEISDSICHFYVGNMDVPKITFPFHEFSSGMIGFEPRVIGSEVWIDNISVEKIGGLSYPRNDQPEKIEYESKKLLTRLKVIGPFRHPNDSIEKDGFVEGKTYLVNDNLYTWNSFKTDGRGCILGGKIIEWPSMKRYAYFSTSVEVPSQEATAIFHASSTNKLAVWVNGEYTGEIERKFKAWYDFNENPVHTGNKLQIKLKKGKNSILIREEGLGWDGYSGDGFFASIELAKE